MASLRSIDVVIVDYFMPEMSGQRFAIAMKRLGSQKAIIMLSAALDVLSKP
jgi:FixJ family two-component response regulator